MWLPRNLVEAASNMTEFTNGACVYQEPKDTIATESLPGTLKDAVIFSFFYIFFGGIF